MATVTTPKSIAFVAMSLALGTGVQAYGANLHGQDLDMVRDSILNVRRSEAKARTYDSISMLQGDLANAKADHNPLEIANRLIDEAFGQAARTTRVEQDPETNEVYTQIIVHVAGNPDDVLSRYDEFTDLWVRQVPPDQRCCIRLGYEFT